jgi:predicted nucleic acid-binding protein
VNFLDTNILLYSISTAADESTKRAIAVALIEQDTCALSVQVLQEFYVQATRKSRTAPLAHDLAVAFIEKWLRFPVQENTLAVLSLALEIKAAYGFSFWDSSIVAAAKFLDCDVLYSEDLTDGQKIGGLTIINPFR